MNSNTQPEEEECSICLDDLRKYGFNTFMRALCCGKGMHIKCRDGVLVSSMSAKQKNQCVMCRTKYPASEKEAVEQLRPWVEKGKAWAQYALGFMYANGQGVDQSYERAVEYYEPAARWQRAVQFGCHVRTRSRCGSKLRESKSILRGSSKADG